MTRGFPACWREVTDSSSPWCGASPNELGLYRPHSAARVLDALIAAFVTPAYVRFDHTIEFDWS